MRVVVVCALIGFSSAARAQQSASELAAESDFLKGVALMKEGHFAEALERLRSSEKLSSASGTLLDIAYCERQLGHSASAWLAYRQALGSADARGKSEHSAIARQGLSELEPELPYLLLRLPSSQPPWSLELDGEPFVPSEAPIPIDPGQHQLRATAGADTFQRDFSIAPREQKAIELPAPRLAAPTAPPAAQAPPPIGATAPKSAAQARLKRTVALVGGGLGAVTLLTGVGVFTHARLEFDSVKCPDRADGSCDPAHARRQSSAKNEASASYAIAGVGAALLGVGLAVWFAPAKSDAAARSSFRFVIDPTEYSLVYRRSF